MFDLRAKLEKASLLFFDLYCHKLHIITVRFQGDIAMGKLCPRDNFTG